MWKKTKRSFFIFYLNSLEKPDESLLDNEKFYQDLYVTTYNELSELFNIETMSLTPAINSLCLNGKADTIIYTKKAK